MATKPKPNCQSCEAEGFTRNNYFTGKLMVERDFTDEQHYFMEKIRLHHQRLHGSGVVCGLRIEAHGEPCDDRYVIVQPGSAIDCCGKDILVTEPEVIDLYAFPAMQQLLAELEEAGAGGSPGEEGAGAPHRLQLCIRYRECPGEEIPVLYDECGCDDSRCAPNRILESFAIDLVIDPEVAAPPLHQPRLTWANTLNIAHAAQVHLHEASNRLYVLTGDDAGILYQVSTDNFAIEASFALGRRGLALTTNGAGDELYVVVAHEDGIAGGDAELWVFDANGANLASGIDREVAITGSDNSAASALCLADDRLLVLFHAGGRLRLWQAGLAAPMDPLNGLDHGADLYGLSAGSDGQFVYSATVAGASIQRFDVSAADFAPATIDGAVDATLDKVSRVAVAVSSAADQLVVLDADNNSLRLVDPAGGADVIGAVALAHPPQAVAVGNGAHWAWVLVNDGFNSLVQSVNLHSLRQGHPVTAGTPVAVGDASRGMVISTGGERLFIPYVGDLALDNAGGVALLDIADANCRDLLWPDDCPSCETSDCLVLATIDNYRPGFRVLDMPTPAPDPLADLGAGIARIDNRLGRQPLPSTQAIAAALACLMENGCGASGGAEQGPPGLPGTPGADGAPGQDGAAGQDGEDGRSISQVDVEMIPCGNPPSGSVSEVGDDLLLSLRIPGNCNPDLAHLCNINWFHDGHYGGESITSLLVVENDQRYLRLLIRFDAPVRARDLNRHSIAVALSEYHSAAYQRMDLHVEIIPGVFSSPPCELKEFIRDERIDDDYADGAEILVPAPWLETMKSGFVLRVSVHGDFIRDQKGRGADLDHLPPWLSNQDPGEATAARTGDHVAGGQFISWLSYTREGKPVDVDRFTIPGLAAFDEPFLASFGAARRGIEPAPGRVAVNRASREELMTLRGVGPELAQAIVHARAATPLRSEADLLRIPGIGDSLLTRLRARISFDNGD